MKKHYVIITLIIHISYIAVGQNKSESAAGDYIGFYQKYISNIRGHHCPMYPSCSSYALNTFQKKNIFTSFILTSDRLVRCGHDHGYYSKTIINDQTKLIDLPINQVNSEDLQLTQNSYYYAYSDTTRDDSILVFIKFLINQQYHQEALLEILRYETTQKNFHIETFINKIICLHAAGEYEKALYDYEVKCPAELKKHAELTYQIALIQYKLKNYDLAIKANTESLKSCTDTFCYTKTLLLNGILYANKYDWENSIKSYESLNEIQPNQHITTINLGIAKGALKLKSKKSGLAAVFSLIPGLGYAYTGHKQTAISSFIVNGLLAYATYSNIRNGNYGMAALTGVFNLSFYISNIYGAANSAKRYNSQQKKSIIDKLEYNSNL